jgi:hypothetical protein
MYPAATRTALPVVCATAAPDDVHTATALASPRGGAGAVGLKAASTAVKSMDIRSRPPMPPAPRYVIRHVPGVELSGTSTVHSEPMKVRGEHRYR